MLSRSEQRLALLMAILQIVLNVSDGLVSGSLVKSAQLNRVESNLAISSTTGSTPPEQLVTRLIFVDSSPSKSLIENDYEYREPDISVEDSSTRKPTTSDPIRKPKELKVTKTNLVKLASENGDPIVVLRDYLPSSSELNMNFLKLFDELWRLKSNSIQALITLEYFTASLNESLSDKGGHTTMRPMLGTESMSSTSVPEVGSTTSTAASEVPAPSGSIDRQKSKTNMSVTAGQQLVLQNPLSSKVKGSTNFMLTIKQQAGEILSNLQGRLKGAFARLKWPTRQAQARPTGRRADNNATGSGLDETVDRLLGLPSNGRNWSRLSRPRRGALEPECVQLSSSQTKSCQANEAFVGASLNVSFPGTLATIEDNCRKISYLMGVCWPEQLEMLKVVLGSRNETLLSVTDFPLPGSESWIKQRDDGDKSNYIARSCGLSPALDQVVLERITWMWLNLCMDRRFRLDYTSNLKCLSLWSQERARMVCSGEYRRMQSNMASRELVEVADTELESKTICCAFDLFLRCVHRQAVRDCGRTGGQFVVNFMSRVGSEDMKYLCNSEPRQITRNLAKQQQQQQPIQQQQQQQTSGVGQRARLKVASVGAANQKPDRGPFIESGYCAESKVSVALHEGLSSNLSPQHQLGAGSGSSGARSSANNGGRDSPRKNAGSSNQVLDYQTQYPATSNSCSEQMVISMARSAMFMVTSHLLFAWIL